MALDISKLARLSEFSLELTSLGTVRCLSLNTNHISKASKNLDSPNIHSSDFVRWLFGEIARRPVEALADEANLTDTSCLTAEELNSVMNEELEEIADKLIQNNKYFLKTHKSSDLVKSVDESACDFLVRAFRHHAAEQKAQWERLRGHLSSSLFTGKTLEAMQRNFGLSNQLQDTIDKYARGSSGVERILAEEKDKWECMNQSISQSLAGSAVLDAMQRISAAEANIKEPRLDGLNYRTPEIHIPKNPIHETNEKLGNVVKKIEDLRPMAAQAAELIHSMNDTALRMQADYIENAKSAGRLTRIAIWIAAVSLLMSAIGLGISSFFSYQSYVDGRVANEKSEAQAKAFKDEIRDLATAYREGQAAFIKTIGKTSRVSEAAIKGRTGALSGTSAMPSQKTAP